MFLRTSSISLIPLALAGCGEPSGAPDGTEVACAFGQGAELVDECIFEIVERDLFVIHRPDGGFRRFTLEQESAGPVPRLADGAEQLVWVRLSGGTRAFEFTVNDERYRLDAGLLEKVSND